MPGIIFVFFSTFWICQFSTHDCYRRHNKDLEVEKKKTLSLYEFKSVIADSLMRTYKPGKRLSSALSVAAKFRPGPRLSMPSSDMRFDQTGHWPVMRTNARCKNGNCHATTQTACDKCNVYLCLTKRKRFLSFCSFVMETCPQLLLSLIHI